MCDDEALSDERLADLESGENYGPQWDIEMRDVCFELQIARQIESEIRSLCKSKMESDVRNGAYYVALNVLNILDQSRPKRVDE